MEHTEPYSCFKWNEFFKYLLPRAHLLRKEKENKKKKTMQAAED